MRKEATFYQDGKTVDLELKEAVNVGDVIPLGTEGVAIACSTGLEGEIIAADIEGVYEINANTASAILAWQEVFFDATTREITPTAGSNVRVGRAVYAKKAGTASTVYVKINVA